jgi:hypothetical protein
LERYRKKSNKGIERRVTPKSSPVIPKAAHIYTEPARELKFLTGSLCISTTNDQAVVFELSNTNHLKLRVLDTDMLQVNVRLQDQQGNELLRVVENHVRVVGDKDISSEFVAGHARVTVPITSDFIPPWLVDHVRKHDQTYAADGRIVALDIEVLKPGLLRVRGCWPDGTNAVVITERALIFSQEGTIGPSVLLGCGEATVISYSGPITKALFRFAENGGGVHVGR